MEHEREHPERLRARNRDALHDVPGDDAVAEDVCNAILGADIDAAEVEVAVEAGVVTLRGDISDATARQKLEQLVFDVPGVRSVESDLVVVPHPRSTAAPSEELPRSRPLSRSFGGAR